MSYFKGAYKDKLIQNSGLQKIKKKIKSTVLTGSETIRAGKL